MEAKRCSLCGEEITGHYIKHDNRSDQLICMLCVEDAKEDFEVGITIEQMEDLEMNSDWTAETIGEQIGELIEKGAVVIRDALQKSRDDRQADFEIRMCKSTSDFRDNGGGYRTIRTKIRRSIRIVIETLSQYLPCVHLEKSKQHHWTTMLAMAQTIFSDHS